MALETPAGYNEDTFVIRRQGIYYLMWSEYDTRDPRYSVAYGTATSPLGPFQKAERNPILQGKGMVRGAGHHAVVQVPGKDLWFIAYHRFAIPDGSIQEVDIFEAAVLNPSMDRTAEANP